MRCERARLDGRYLVGSSRFVGAQPGIQGTDIVENGCLFEADVVERVVLLLKTVLPGHDAMRRDE